ncbi:type IV pilin N-terminal domain-containing protein [Salinigranum salinum]|uniref:type IV pilin N-terminal domain-containing protein n=1 Tax=Salinigranum salinum TaxID=1364937 RepID=UPI0012607812|nr:type IV pilin N-terminal domain-containing protein [Salinigranum salinum]
MHAPDGRGQANVIGVLLLTGIVVSAAAAFGGFYLTSTLEQSSSAASDVDVVAIDRGGTTTLTVRHTIGETIDDGQVVLRSRGEIHEMPDSFVEGTRWTTPISGAPAGTRLDVLVVENATGTVVFEGRVTVVEPTLTATPAPAYGPPTTTPTPASPPTSTATPTSTSTATPMVTPTATSTATPTSTPTATSTATPTSTPPPDDPPTITTFDVTSPGKSGKIDADWAVTDDAELTSLDLTVRRDGAIVAERSPDVSGTSQTGETQFKDLDGGTYEVEIVVRDSGNAATTATETVTVESPGSGGNGNENGNGSGNGNGNGSGNGNGNGNGKVV